MKLASASKKPRVKKTSTDVREHAYQSLQPKCSECRAHVPAYYCRYIVDRENLPWIWHPAHRCYYDNPAALGEWSWEPICFDCYTNSLPIELLVRIPGAVRVTSHVSRAQALIAGLTIKAPKSATPVVEESTEPESTPVTDSDGNILLRRTWLDLEHLQKTDEAGKVSQGYAWIKFGEAVNGQPHALVIPIDVEDVRFEQTRWPTCRLGMERTET